MTWFLLTLLGLAAIAGAVMYWSYLQSGSPTGALFGPKPERRLQVVDQASVDGRRRLILIRRDDVEHLIMTGGPIDIVVETGILGASAAAPAALAGPRPKPTLATDQDKDPPTLSRPPRTFGQAAGE